MTTIRVPDDLLQRVVEGDASADEMRAVQAALVTDPELRERHDELREAFAALATARLEPPPPELRTAIMRDVRALAAPRPAPLRGRPEWMRWALPAAAGLAAGVLVWGGFTGTLDLRRNDLAGTMGAGRAPLHEVALGDARRSVRLTVLEAGRDGFLVRLLASGERAVVLLDSPDGSLALDGPASPEADPAPAGWVLEPGAPLELRMHAEAAGRPPVLRAVVRSWTPPSEVRLTLHRGS